ncbi:MAG: YbhB/YbcL family Raf kinase inhibitor-like protein [Gammaproteobacteria bacterium]|nr:YbhB/YbcL family Raf kinase inhibitor-like protein [Gammaproteobacteria bacterium]MBU1777514.1 YbhB/YbcL family Raf kinase inhibitor-like protein [Gammaproteobacteria bacterium]MBU1968103.1 YbhB/YbcL family Raf kinase inhibitor-like protein [Gammaproteobacteria bacterium]
MSRILIIALAALFAGSAMAFELSSPDPEVTNGRPMPKAQEFRGMGCNGDNLSPELVWKDPPAGTLSFAVTVFDPDAPTGSGWWHWVVYDIPATATGLPAGAVIKAALPTGTKQGRNDFGLRNFGGACPPVGDKPHHYVFMIHALKVEKLNVPDDASPALIGFMLHSNRLGLAKMTTTYSR